MAVDIPTLILADLQQGNPVTDAKGMPSDVLLRTLNGNNRNLRRVIAALVDITADLATQLTLIQAAQATANSADAKATAGVREAARINSYPQPTNVLTATDAGATASIVIANHARVYPVQGTYKVPDVAITGTTLTGLAFSTTYAVYYDDTTLADTTPNFLTTTDLTIAHAGAAAGRHVVGTITTPADGAGDTTGEGGRPPGGWDYPI
jgi:hypothetical protein